MLQYLNECFESSDAFVLDLFMNDGSQLLRCSALRADQIGLALNDIEGELRLVPWASIGQIVMEIS